MRDEFGEIDPDEIDILDADPDAFGALPLPPDQPESEAGVDTLTRRRPRWLVRALAASAVALVGAGVLVWQPWADDTDTGGVSFPSASTDGSEALTEQLVFGEPPGELTLAGLGDGDNDVGGFGLDGAVGYFFAEPGARFQFGQGGAGRWAAFFAVALDSPDAPTVDVEDATAGTIQGSPASVSLEGGGPISVEFGPVDGRMFSVATSDMSRAETLAFAEAVGVDGDTALVADSSVLGEMMPLGTVAEYFDVLQLAFQSSAFGGFGPGMISVHYGGGNDTYTLSSVAAGDDGLAMMHFVFGDGVGAASSVTVHDLPAIATTTGDQAFADEPVNFVAWVEGGRLVMVTGPDELDDLVALAETVRPASDDEWADVVAVAVQTGEFDEFPVEADHAALIDGDLPGGGTFEFSVGFADGMLTMCLDEETANGGSGVCSDTPHQLPLLLVEHRDGLSFLLAMTDSDVSSAEVRLHIDDDTVETYPLDEWRIELPGPAAAWVLPDEWLRAELVIDGEVVEVTER